MADLFIISIQYIVGVKSGSLRKKCIIYANTAKVKHIISIINDEGFISDFVSIKRNKIVNKVQRINLSVLWSILVNSLII